MKVSSPQRLSASAVGVIAGPGARGSERRVRVVLAVLLLLLLAPAARLFGHVSESPAVWGRWSKGYALLLLGYALDVAMVALFAAAPQRLIRCGRGLGRVRAGALAACLTVWGIVGVWALPFLVGGSLTAAAVWGVAAVGAVGFFAGAPSRDPAAAFNRLWGSGAAQGLVLSLVALFVAFLSVEAGLRIFRPALWVHGPFVNDPLLGLRVTGFTPVNHWGFRDREYPPAKPAGGVRVLGLGDSFTFGTGVPMEATFLKTVEDRLNHGRAGSVVEVLNFSIPSNGPRDTLRILRRVGLAVGPDAVVHHFYVGNDFWDNTPGSDWVALNGMPVSVARPEWLGGFPEWKWYTLEYAAILRQLGRADLRKAAGPGGAERFPEDLYLAMRRQGLEKYRRKTVEGADQRAQVAYVRGLLLEMVRASREAGVPFALVVLPEEMQVDPAFRRQLLERFHLREEEYDFDFPSRFFARLAAEEKLPVLDFTPILRERTATEKLFLPLDGHLTAAGHRVVADALEPFLRSRITGLQEARP